MKNHLLLLSLFIVFFSQVQSQNNIPFVGDCLNSKPYDELSLHLNNHTLSVSGILTGNCCGNNFLSYDNVSNPFVMTIDHSGNYCYCFCPFEINFEIPDFNYDSLHVIIEPNILDTVIYERMVNVTENIHSSDCSVKCYPNPTSNSFTIEFPNPTLTDFTFLLFNNTGKMIIKENSRDRKIVITKGNFTSGVYFFHLYSNNKHYNGKVLFEN